MDRIAIVLPVHNRKDFTLDCLRQLQGISRKGFASEIVLVDDGSADGTAEAVSQTYPEVSILKGDGNLWWAGGVNKGMEYALANGFDFIYTLNDDIDFFPDSLQVLYDTLKDRRDCVCGSIFLSFKNRENIVYAGIEVYGFFRKLRSCFKGPYRDEYEGRIGEADTLSTKSTLTPAAVVRKVGLLDAVRFPHNYADFDYFMRVKSAGFPLLVHYGSRICTRGSDTNFHRLIMNKSRKEVFRTFFDIKYGNHLPTLYHYSTARVNFLRGQILFLHNFIPYAFWLVMRAVLPKKWLERLLRRTGRLKQL